MSQLKINILDYGVGNVKSLEYFFSRIGFHSTVSRDMEIISKSDILVFPGVGSFDSAMAFFDENIEIESHVRNVSNDNKKMILGICLGFQVAGKSSEEGNRRGLNLFNFETKKLSRDENLKTKNPHIGWNTLTYNFSAEISKLANINGPFYFNHNFYVDGPIEESLVGSTTHSTKFLSFYNEKNFYGMQFHPEKSYTHGEEFITTIIREFYG